MSGVSDDSIQQFMALANCSLGVAQQYLEEFSDLGEALNAFYAAKSGSPEENQASQSPVPEKTPVSRASSTVSGRSANAGSVGSGGRPAFMSFSDMVRGQAADDDEDDNRNTFAGGETSGLEVTDPNDSNSLIKDLFEKARRGAQQQAEAAPEQRPVHNFTGKGYKLGSVVDSPNQVVEDLREEALPSRPQKVTREITFWKEGFQVGDGPLYRYDDPANSFYLSELNQGRAPLKLLNVEFGQEVDVNVFKKMEESFKAPKRKLGGFQGQGQRLGSPIPGESESSSVEPTLPTADQSEKINISKDAEKQPAPRGDSSVQIRYASGKREVFRCNATDTVQVLYDHVNANTQDKSRKFTLNYAFPVKPLEKFDATLKEADLINTVVLQRWV